MVCVGKLDLDYLSLAGAIFTRRNLRDLLGPRVSRGWTLCFPRDSIRLTFVVCWAVVAKIVKNLYARRTISYAFCELYYKLGYIYLKTIVPYKSFLSFAFSGISFYFLFLLLTQRHFWTDNLNRVWLYESFIKGKPVLKLIVKFVGYSFGK